MANERYTRVFPPCPRCGRSVETVLTDPDGDDLRTVVGADTTAGDHLTDLFLAPCQHRINGFFMSQTGTIARWLF